MEGYEDRPEQKVTIAAGKRATVQFDLTPIVTTAYLRIEGGTPDADINVITGTADPERFYPFEREVRIAFGQRVAIDVILTQKVEQISAPARRKDVPELLSGNWRRADGGFWQCLAPATLRDKYFHHVFDAKRITRKLQWRTYTQGNSYVEFELDANNYSRRIVTQGKTGESRKIAHRVNSRDPYRLDLTVGSAGITVKVGKAEDNVAVRVENQTVFEAVSLRLRQ